MAKNFKWSVAMHIIPPGKTWEDEKEIENYVEAPTSKAAAIKAIQEWVADDELIHMVHVGRPLKIKGK